MPQKFRCIADSITRAEGPIATLSTTIKIARGIKNNDAKEVADSIGAAAGSFATDFVAGFVAGTVSGIERRPAVLIFSFGIGVITASVGRRAAVALLGLYHSPPPLVPSPVRTSGHHAAVLAAE